MAIFSCLAVFLVGKKKRSKISLKDVADDKKHLDDIELHVKSSNLASSSVHNTVQDSHFTFPKPSTFLEKRTSDISKVRSSDSLARVEFAIGETAYEGGDEHDEIQSMKREFSDFDLQDKRELASHGSNTDLNNFGFVNKVETYDGINNEIALANGHVSDPGLKQSFVMGSPVLKRSCSNIETKRATDLFNSVNRSNSYINFQNLVAMGREEISYEAYSSPLSVKTSCSADHVMLKKRSSCQVLPSRSRKIWWKLFLWSHRNLHRPGAPKQITPDFRDSKQKVGYSSDTHEPGRKHEKMKNKLIENQWVAFSLESSPRDRVNAWINSLGDCALSDEEYLDEKRVEGPAGPLLLEIGESSGKNHYHTSQQAAEEVLWANNIIQSLNSFSSVAHISNMGLKVIPSISAFGSLRSINLSGNFISHISPGSLPKNLHILDLSRNKISTIEGLRDLTKLRVLNLSYNRISRIGHGISNCTLIKELYLAGNKISDVEGLHRLLKLTVLDLSFNKITTSKALGQLVANYNSLSALNLIGNPIQSCIGDELIRKTVLSLLPRISYFNKQQIKQHRIREIPANTKTALGDAGWGAQRRPVRRLGQVTRSSLDNKKGGKWKGKHHHSSSASRK